MSSRRLLAGLIALLALAAVGLGVTVLFLLTPQASKLVLFSLQESADGYSVPTEHPFLWKVNRSPPSFLYGTIHVSDTRVLELPAVVKTAFRGSDALYTEVPFTRRARLKMTSEMIVPNNRPLEERIPSHIHEKLRRYGEQHDVQVRNFSRFKIWAVVMMLPRIESIRRRRRQLEELNFNRIRNRPPLDQWLYLTAREQDKITGGLESPEEQADVFDELSRQEQVHWLSAELDARMNQVRQGINPMERMIRLYLQGKGEELSRMTMATGGVNERFQRKFRRLVIDRRNGWMARRASRHMRRHPDRMNFFAVGAAHLVGDGNIRDRLLADGFSTERVPATSEAVTGLEREIR